MPRPLNDIEVELLGLSRREAEVLVMVATGMSNQQIADDLHLSINSVKSHVQHIFQKLDLHDRTRAAVWVWARPEVWWDLDTDKPEAE